MQRVLVVAPQDLRAELRRTVLGRDDIELKHVKTAAAGRKAMLARRSRLVVIALGKREATERFLKQCRADKRTRNASLVVMLPTLLPAEEKSLRGSGASAVLAGPVDPFRWNALLEKLLRVADRRVATIPVRFWVWYRLSGDEKPVRAQALNISIRGMLLETDQAVEVETGTQVETEFTLPERVSALQAVGRVVREAGSKKGRRRFAIEFPSLPPTVHDHIEAFVSAAGKRA